MPNMSDSARKRTLADWVVKTKKQVVKLYAVAKWARDAETVQKCMVYCGTTDNTVVCTDVIRTEYHSILDESKSTIRRSQVSTDLRKTIPGFRKVCREYRRRIRVYAITMS